MLLRKIKEILNPPKSQDTPLSLTKGDIAKLKSLRGALGWKEYQALLDRLAALYGEQLLGKSDNNEIHFLRGSILALRRAGTIVDEIIQHMEGKDAERDRRAADDERRTELARRLATYGTPFWTESGGSV